MERAEVAAFWEANADAWTRHSRAGYDIYRDALHTPVFLATLPPVTGLSGLDIGCGEGSNTRQVARRGARMQGIDVAPTFVRHASASEQAEPLGIVFGQGDAMALPFADASFDFATAFMCLMDVPDPALALQEAQRVLRPGGFLQFSILHPCFVPAHRKVLRDASGQPRAIEIAGYFDRNDGRIETWWFDSLPAEQRETDAPFRTPCFDRTLSEWVDMILAAGLAIEKMVEPSASAELAQNKPVVADTRIAPIALILRARKPA